METLVTIISYYLAIGVGFLLFWEIDRYLYIGRKEIPHFARLVMSLLWIVWFVVFVWHLLEDLLFWITENR